MSLLDKLIYVMIAEGYAGALISLSGKGKDAKVKVLTLDDIRTPLPTCADIIRPAQPDLLDDDSYKDYIPHYCKPKRGKFKKRTKRK